MDRLLRMAFEKLVRVGNLQVSTAGGSTFTFGDGTGRPVAIRFQPRLKLAIVELPRQRPGDTSARRTNSLTEVLPTRSASLISR
jgi:hypothetical protein